MLHFLFDIRKGGVVKPASASSDEYRSEMKTLAKETRVVNFQRRDWLKSEADNKVE